MYETGPDLDVGSTFPVSTIYKTRILHPELSIFILLLEESLTNHFRLKNKHVNI